MNNDRDRRLADENEQDASLSDNDTQRTMNAEPAEKSSEDKLRTSTGEKPTTTGAEAQAMFKKEIEEEDDDSREDDKDDDDEKEHDDKTMFPGSKDRPATPWDVLG